VKCNTKFCSERKHEARKASSVGTNGFVSYELRSVEVRIYWVLRVRFCLWDDSHYRWRSWPNERMYHLSNDDTAPPPPWRLKTCRYMWRQLSASLLQLCAQQGRSGTETTVRCFSRYSPRAVFTWNYYKCILLPYTQAPGPFESDPLVTCLSLHVIRFE